MRCLFLLSARVLRVTVGSADFEEGDGVVKSSLRFVLSTLPFRCLSRVPSPALEEERMESTLETARVLSFSRKVSFFFDKGYLRRKYLSSSSKSSSWGSTLLLRASVLSKKHTWGWSQVICALLMLSLLFSPPSSTSPFSSPLLCLPLFSSPSSS